MKKLFSRLTAACLCLFILLPTAASASGLDLFTKKNTYTSGQFSDVSASAWYAESVQTCYELGLMSGYEDGTFRPGGNITLAECIVIAARVHKTETSRSIAKSKDSFFFMFSPSFFAKIIIKPIFRLHYPYIKNKVLLLIHIIIPAICSWR